MCDLVEEYAREFADEEKIKLMVDVYREGEISLRTVLKKLNLTEEQFMGYVEKYTE